MPRLSQIRKQQRDTDNTVGKLKSREPSLARKIKYARTIKGMRLQELSRRANLSLSLLSKFETDKAIPSLSNLHRIASALDFKVAWFFRDEIGTAQPLIRRCGRRVRQLKSERTKIEDITPDDGGPSLQILIITIKAGGGPRNILKQTGDVRGYMIEGELELLLDGAKYRLIASDAFNFRSERSHAYRNSGKREGKLVLIFRAALL